MQGLRFNGTGSDAATESIAFWGHALLEGSKAFRSTCVDEEDQAWARLMGEFTNGLKSRAPAAVLVTMQAWEALLSAVAMMRVTSSAPECEAVCTALENCHLSTRWVHWDGASAEDFAVVGSQKTTAASPQRDPLVLQEQMERLVVASEEQCAWQALQQGHHWALLFTAEVQKMAAAVNADADAVRAQCALTTVEHTGRTAIAFDQQCEWAALLCTFSDSPGGNRMAWHPRTPAAHELRQQYALLTKEADRRHRIAAEELRGWAGVQHHAAQEARMQRDRQDLWDSEHSNRDLLLLIEESVWRNVQDRAAMSQNAVAASPRFWQRGCQELLDEHLRACDLQLAELHCEVVLDLQAWREKEVLAKRQHAAQALPGSAGAAVAPRAGVEESTQTAWEEAPEENSSERKRPTVLGYANARAVLGSEAQRRDRLQSAEEGARQYLLWQFSRPFAFEQRLEKMRQQRRHPPSSDPSAKHDFLLDELHAILGLRLGDGLPDDDDRGSPLASLAAVCAGSASSVARLGSGRRASRSILSQSAPDAVALQQHGDSTPPLPVAPLEATAWERPAPLQPPPSDAAPSPIPEGTRGGGRRPSSQGRPLSAPPQPTGGFPSPEREAVKRPGRARRLYNTLVNGGL
eukprot:GGOE01045907.1.p1 GENE.GGOE01045907.1~~GGOE01045907.1.p1  ORF type:complete len:633 (-),score=146.14 GGOE01045907.1:264-2162(-)